MTDPGRQAFAFVNAFVDELARCGVRDICAAPGSRSTPLALTIANRADLRLWMHLDERSAAFFALGIARARGAPAAVLCTSGTAAANFYPAVVEAQAAGVPLLVFTADRPPELREVGAAQTIDQNHLFGSHAKWFVEVALAESDPGMLRYARTLACRAVGTARALPAGPVHLNFPFREPLVPVPTEPPADIGPEDRVAWNGRADGAPFVMVTRGQVRAADHDLRAIGEALSAATRPLIVCGPQYDDALAAPLCALASAIGAPVLADPLSQLRWGPHLRGCVVEGYDATLRAPEVAARMAPDVVLRVGGTPTSRALLDYLQRHAGARHIVIDPARWPDPLLVASTVLRAEPALACQDLVTLIGGNRADDGWLRRWLSLDSAACRALSVFCASLEEPFEGRALAEVAELVPDGGTLFVSSSMPVRDLDTFGRSGTRAVKVLANRGANGIDGVVSSALGAASVAGPLVLVIGDIALYHDLNGLLAAKRHRLDATVVLLNNDGGGIFSFLPQASQAEHFETLFGTPHGLDFASAARMYDATYCHAERWDTFRGAVNAGIAGSGLHLVEMRTDRARNVELHRQARDAVSRALSGLVV